MFCLVEAKVKILSETYVVCMTPKMKLVTLSHSLARIRKWLTLLRLSSFTMSKSNANSIDNVAENNIDDVEHIIE